MALEGFDPCTSFTSMTIFLPFRSLFSISEFISSHLGESTEEETKGKKRNIQKKMSNKEILISHLAKVWIFRTFKSIAVLGLIKVTTQKSKGDCDE
ncbi:MAG: hypothetical protein A2X49_09305 [Lentisphaerae bacterium GWF2_52_8]|nr:MAG: hypothetical protein A2X49_09305 [Lentisphaerae bacterium GWF2_52_8]